MEKPQIEKDSLPSKFESIERFRDLFALLRSRKFSKEYHGAYDEAAELAKSFVGAKNKPSWDPVKFKVELKQKYSDISEEFVEALGLCIANYNPVVNIPPKPLWE